MGRTILGVLAGMVVAWLVIMLCQFASARLYPLPPGLDLGDTQQLAAYVASAPKAAMALVLASWALGAFAGGWTAARIAERHPKPTALVVGLLVLAGVVANMMMIPHPTWMVVLGVLLPVPAALLASTRPRGA